MIKQEKATIQERKVYCRKCKQSTRHKVLNEEVVVNYWKEIDEGEIFKYFTLKCMGCEIVCLLEEYSYSEDRNPVTGEDDVRVTFYPSPFKSREIIDKIYHVPEIIKYVYIECVSAVNADLLILCSIGIRTVIEAICKDKQINNGTLENKIDELVKKGLMTDDGVKLLHMTRIMGNLSAHEIKRYKSEELALCLDIIETVLQNTYILPIEVERMKNR